MDQFWRSVDYLTEEISEMDTEDFILFTILSVLVIPFVLAFIILGVIFLKWFMLIPALTIMILLYLRFRVSR